MRSLGNRVSVAAKGLGKIIRGDEQDVRFFSKTVKVKKQNALKQERRFHFFFFGVFGRSADGLLVDRFIS